MEAAFAERKLYDGHDEDHGGHGSKRNSRASKGAALSREVSQFKVTDVDATAKQMKKVRRNDQQSLRLYMHQVFPATSLDLVC